ncbi:MAG: sugar phosphate isomerase/epimerase [Clostridia bacterium]|nr:sugar phosphate isomerase/epimerase [Clostridia bacterium]
MKKAEIGISLNHSYALPTKEVIRLVSKIGFNAVSIEWKEDVNLKELCSLARENGLYVQSFHGPYRGAADMWSNNETAVNKAKEQLISCIKDCKENSVPVMVIHCWIGFDYTDTPTKEGLKNYGEIIALAEKCGVKVALENTEGTEFLGALLDNFKSEYVGFCYDSGHELCYSPMENLTEKFGDRLLMCHLNDNLSISDKNGKISDYDDLHLLPFDGIADWDNIVKGLKKSKSLPFLNFEVKINNKFGRKECEAYAAITIEEYFTECYKRALIIAEKYF